MRERQEDLWYGGELPIAPGHPFYKRLNEVLDNAKFDRFCETNCATFYHDKLGRPSLPPGQYFRIMMIGVFSSRPIERNCRRVSESATRHAMPRSLSSPSKKPIIIMRKYWRRRV